MISPEQFDELASSIVSATEQVLVADIEAAMLDALGHKGELGAKDWRAVEQAAQDLEATINQALLSRSTLITGEVRTAVSEVLRTSMEDDVHTLSMGAAASVAPIGVTALFRQISSQTLDGLTSIIARQNIAMASEAERAWYEVAGKAVDEWNHGTKTQDAILTDSVTELMARGMQTVDYASGVHSQIDVAIRRHIISQAGQASGRMTAAAMVAYGHDLVMVSAHAGARPSHAAWQGKAYGLNGPVTRDGVHYPGLVEATGYGTVTGLQGVNCRHSWGPYYPGISELPKVPATPNGMSDADYYAATQKQRAYEAAIRKTKREIAGLESKGLSSVQQRLVLGNQQRTLKAYCDENDLVRQAKREKAYGIGGQPTAITSVKKAKAKKAFDKALSKGYRTFEKELGTGEKYEEWGKKDSEESLKRFLATATESERAAVAEYTGSSYSTINEILRKGQVSKTADAISSGLSKAPTLGNRTVWRRMSSLPGELAITTDGLPDAIAETINNGFISTKDEDLIETAENLWKSRIGGTFENKSFMSTSRKHLGISDFGSSIFELRVPSGSAAVGIEDISQYGNELEVLLDKGYNVTITDVYTINLEGRTYAVFVGTVGRP